MLQPLREGIHFDITDARYHADPCETPSASSGALRRLLEFSPEHASAGHPRLNPSLEAKPATDAMNRGTILHSLTLGTPAPHRVLDVLDYKTAAARLTRDAVIAEGLIPIKAADLEELQDVAASLRARLQGMPEVWTAVQDAVSIGATEATLIWRERDVLCRCRYDTLPAERFRATYDFKFTGVSAEPSAFGKKVVSDYAIQADLYPRAVRALRGDRPMFVFVACETEAPYGVSLHALDPEAAAVAAEKVDAALDTWRGCLEGRAWPSYPPLIHYQGLAPWVSKAWQERQLAGEHSAAIARERP